MRSKDYLMASGAGIALALGFGIGGMVTPADDLIIPFLALIAMIFAIIFGLLGLAEMSVEDQYGI